MENFYIMMKAQHIIMKHVWEEASIAATGSRLYSFAEI